MALKTESMREMKMFLDDKGKIQYNTKCKECFWKCKQSFRATIVACPKYRDRKKMT